MKARYVVGIREHGEDRGVWKSMVEIKHAEHKCKTQIKANLHSSKSE